MAVTPKISVTDNVAYNFFSKMAKRNNSEYRQIKMNDNLMGNFLMNDTTFDCFITKDGNLIASKGFNTNNPKNFAKEAVDIIHQLHCGKEKTNEILSHLFISV